MESFDILCKSTSTLPTKTQQTTSKSNSKYKQQPTKMAFNLQQKMIKELDNSMRNVEITARVMRKWKRCALEKPELIFGMEMVLIDEEGEVIQATTNKTLVGQFDK